MNKKSKKEEIKHPDWYIGPKIRKVEDKEITKKLHYEGKRYIYARSGEGIKTKGLLLTDSEFKRAHKRWKNL